MQMATQGSLLVNYQFLREDAVRLLRQIHTYVVHIISHVDIFQVLKFVLEIGEQHDDNVLVQRSKSSGLRRGQEASRRDFGGVLS